MGHGLAIFPANWRPGDGLNGMDVPSTLEILMLLLLLQVKHAVFDGPMQLEWMLREKGFYGKRGGIAHASLHGLGTLAVLLVPGCDYELALGLAVFDAVVHYHVDFAKESLVRRNGWTAAQSYFWWALTADQMLHQFTYLAMAAAVLEIA